MVITDVDALLLRDPIPYFQRYSKADILTSSDHLRPTEKDEGLESYPEAATTFNIGARCTDVGTQK